MMNNLFFKNYLYLLPFAVVYGPSLNIKVLARALLILHIQPFVVQLLDTFEVKD